jgi:hypothetical protein
MSLAYGSIYDGIAYVCVYVIAYGSVYVIDAWAWGLNQPAEPFA